MIKIEDAWPFGFDAAIRGMRNPMNSWDKMDSYYIWPDDEEFGSIPLALNFNVSPQTITDIVHNRTWVEALPYSELITGEK